MGTMRTGYKIVLGILLLPPFTAQAQAPVKPLAPLTLEAKYIVAWNGITIGRINLSAHEDATSYSMTVDTKTHGIGTIFSNERRIAEVSGQVKGGHYIPTHYESRPQGKDTGRTSTLVYDTHGQITSRVRMPSDDDRPPVTAEQASQGTDPVTAGFILRRKLYGVMATNTPEVSVKTYDGARFADMHFAVRKPAAKVEVLGNYRDTVTTLVSRQPIAGYTPKEIKIYNKGDPVIHLYFSADEKFIPLRATVSTLFGELSATLTQVE